MCCTMGLPHSETVFIVAQQRSYTCRSFLRDENIGSLEHSYVKVSTSHITSYMPQNTLCSNTIVVFLVIRVVCIFMSEHLL